MEDKEKVTKEGKQKLYEELDSYDVSTSKKGLGLENIAYDNKSDEELKKLAEEYYANDKEDEIASLNQKKEDDTQTLKDKIEELVKNSQSEKASKTTAYDNAKESVENDAIKRGIGRSSIANLSIKDLEEKKLNALNNIDDELKKEIKQIDDEIESLNSDLFKSLSSVDKKYKNLIDNRLQTLITERDEKLSEAIKYNNTVKEKEQEYLDAHAGEGEKDAKAKENYMRRYSAIMNYYNDFDNPYEALEDFLADSNFKNYLGDYYENAYKALYNRTKY